MIPTVNVEDVAMVGTLTFCACTGSGRTIALA
jgi:hypothetical protein